VGTTATTVTGVGEISVTWAAAPGQGYGARLNISPAPTVPMTIKNISDGADPGAPGELRMADM
jgi:hypothetical protein